LQKRCIILKEELTNKTRGYFSTYKKIFKTQTRSAIFGTCPRDLYNAGAGCEDEGVVENAGN
jgi:hypothetical protein